MNLFKKTGIAATALLLALLLGGCSVNISFGSKETTTASTASDTTDSDDAIEYVEGDPYTNSSGAAVAPQTKSVRASKVLKLYKKVSARVKTESVGFKKMQWQDFNEIDTADKSGIADMVLTIVSKNVIKNNTAADAEKNYTVVRSGDSAAVRSEFPLFGYDAAWVETKDDAFITGAEYAKGDGYDEYYLYFAPALNPRIGDEGFGSLMTPFDREEVLTGIKNYGWNVKKDTLKLDCTYTDSYLMFRVDDEDRLIYLEQHLYGEIDAKAEVDLIVASTNFLNGKCRYEEHYTYTEFDYN